MRRLTLILAAMVLTAAAACTQTTAPRKNGYAVAYDQSPTCRSGYWIGTGYQDSTFVCTQY